MANPYELNSADSDRIYQRIADKTLSNTEPQRSPKAIIIAGQPGSGKGTLAEQAARELHKEGGMILVDTDKLRSRHPNHTALMQENDRAAASLTHTDASKWADRLTNDAIDGKRNLVLDQTSSSPEWLLKRTTQLREAGYEIELRVMAVNKETSELRIESRYEKQKASEGSGRHVPQEFHDSAYAGIPQSVAAVERLKAVDALKIYDKNQHKIYENELHKGEWMKQPPGGKVAVDVERGRPLTIQDHRERAQAYKELSDMQSKRNADPADRESIEARKVKIERRLTAETFRQLPVSEALKTHPELAGAYAAVAATSAKVKDMGLPADQRKVVMDQFKHTVAASIEQGKIPQVKAREATAQHDTRQEIER